MATNIDDSHAVATDLRTLAGQLTELKASLTGSGANATGSTSAGTPIGVAIAILVGLLAWLAIPAVVSLWAGARLLRGGSRNRR